MKRLTATVLALGLAAAGAASAQSYGSDPYRTNYNSYNGYGQPTVDRYGQTSGATYDYARVIRVDPVRGTSGYSRTGYGQNSYGQSRYGRAGQRCYSDSYAQQGGYSQQGGYYGNDPYRSNSGYYGRDPYYPQRQSRYGGSNTGATVATVVGGIAGAVLGSKVGGGSGTYAASALGSMVGGMAGRQVYEAAQRRNRPSTVEICDPVPVGSGYGSYQTGSGQAGGYDVTYEYAGRTYRTRTNYHPGDRIRVRVDVRPE